MQKVQEIIKRGDGLEQMEQNYLHKVELLSSNRQSQIISTEQTSYN